MQLSLTFPITELQGAFPTNAEILFKFIAVDTKFADWITRRINKYSFTENQDYIVKTTYTGRRPRKEYFITLDMAKELCMVENNERGKEARRYFIECEKRLTRLKSIEQTNRIANLEAIAISKERYHAKQINGYKAQLAKHNEKIKVLKARLTIAENEAKNLSSDDELLEKLEWLFKRALADGVIYAINSSRDKIINDALKKASDEFMSNLHLLKNQ
ncbi:antA/AntB antirepressor family protein [Campylobacter hyointestinalis]|uniref:antA/AntB antirepressor family protein n=1 Tax=Campylobacter hyointestinalis TaxID=198 RepID=UPI000DCB0F43|nr:antA/AntB antirepressor family protein [Campylobacter hyointestinalis]RAZ49190.1 phage antirepressor Ant [Campylobacter hyointestinalis subsp. lawsonii]